jgi:glucokinase
MADVIIGVDLGGTRIRAARLDLALNILQREEILTEAADGPDAVIERMIGLIRRVLPEDLSQVKGIGVSSPGPLNPVTGVVIAPLNLPGWHHVPLADRLHAAFNVPVYVGNDANVAVLAEVAQGAARGHKNAIYITVSTGVGSGILVDGRLLLGRDGYAAELGYTMVLDSHGQPVILEREASGTGIARIARERLAAGEKSQMLDLVDGDISRVGGKVVGQAAKAGDPLALEIYAYAGRTLGLAIVSLLHLFNPEIIVIGGGVTAQGDLIFNPIRETVKAYVVDDAYLQDMPIVLAELGEDVSIIGAAALIQTQGGAVSLLE